MALIGFSVDGRSVQAEPGQNLLEACLAAAEPIPYFCWHRAMGSAGACRQCAVKLFDGPADVEGRIVMSCMTEITADMRVSIRDAQAAKFREAMIELVLTNHPHDCPVCEVGGECHLQDMAVLTGHAGRRARVPKRTHLNQDLGPYIKHEMNRCIGCYRCVRFYRDYAGGTDFGVFGSSQNVYFGRAADGALESPFAGNLVEVCPTGVFVDKPFSEKFRRKWDMRSTPSVCPHCAAGCNINVQERGGLFRRVTNRYNATLNGDFLCDRGRFGVGFLNAPTRFRDARRRSGDRLGSADASAALAGILAGGPVIGIGSPRASIESNFALRAAVGPENFYAGVSAQDAAFMEAAVDIMRATPVATLREAERADEVLVVGQDPAAAAPRLALALRQAGRVRHLPGGSCRAVTDSAICIAGEIGTAAPGRIAQDLLAAQHPVVVAGGTPALLYAAANIVLALRRRGVAARLSPLLPEANSLGLALLGNRPAAHAAGALPDSGVIVLENDPRRYGGPDLAAARCVCVLDHIETPALRAADFAIPVGSFAETDGSFINMEGRLQRCHQAVFGPAVAPAAWRILGMAELAELRRAIAAAIPALAQIIVAAPPAATQPIPTLPYRYSGRTAATAHLDVREPAPPAHPGSAFGTTMEGAAVAWVPGWNSVQASTILAPHGDELFVFAPPARADDFALPPKPWAEPALQLEEELSALSPAVIARRQCP